MHGTRMEGSRGTSQETTTVTQGRDGGDRSRLASLQDWWTSAEWMGEVGNKGESSVMPG